MAGEEIARRDNDGEEWRRWGPYLSERAWGTVREDYSPDGEAWSHFPHDQARSRDLPLERGRPRAASATTSSCCAWRSPSGTGATRS